MEKKAGRARKTSKPAMTGRGKKSRVAQTKDQSPYLAVLFNHVSDAIISTDDKFNVLSWNAAAETIYGWKAKEVIGRPVDDFLKTDYQEAAQEQAAIQQVQGNGHWRGEVTQSRRDGTRFPVLASVATLQDDTGQIIGFVAINRDITEHKRMREALSTSEKYFRTLIENSTDGIALVDAKGNVKYASPAITRILGYPVDEYIGHSAFEFIHTDDLQTAEAALRKLLEQPNASVLMHVRERHKDGSWRSLEGHAVNLLDEPGIEAIVANFRDITERKQVEEALRKGEEQYRMLFESNPHPMWVYDTSTLAFLAVNDAAISHYRYSRDEFLKMTIREIRPAEEQQRLEQNLRVQSASQQRSGPWIHQKKDGTLIHVEITSHDITFLGQAARLVLANDITERNRIQEQLLENEIHLLASQRIARVGSWELDLTVHEDLDINPLRWSDECYRVFGFEPGEVQVTNEVFWGRVHPEDHEKIKKAVQHAIEKRSVYEIDHRIVLTDGSIRILHERAELITDPKTGEPKKFLGTAQDITERRRADERFRTLLEAAPDAMVIVNTDGQIVLVNSQTERLFGYSRESLINQSVEMLIPQQFRDKHPVHRTEYVTRPRPRPMGVGLQLYGLRKDGAEFPVEISLSPLEMEGGTLVTAAIRDVTERKKAEQELRDSQERFRELADNIEEVFWITEPERKKELYISPAGERIWGRPIQKIEDFVEGLLVEDRPMVLAALERQKRGQKTEIEYRVQHADGTTHWIWDRAFPIFDQTGKLVRVAGIAADVTERKRAEEIIQQYAAELERRVEERTVDLTRANRAKDEFLANMSHELRTPLNSILGLSEILADGVRGPLNERQQEGIQVIRSSGHHLLGLINDILDVSKIEAGRLDFHPEVIDVNETCGSGLVFVKEMASKKSIDLQFVALQPPRNFFADPQRMRQILVNLLTNSIKFTPEHGKVTLDVTTDAEEGHIIFRVNDTGIGISPDDQEKLFHPFMQVDGSLTRQNDGSGLGLALVQKLVKMHGGQISVESEIGRGSSFTVTLPWSQKMDLDQKKNLTGSNTGQEQHKAHTAADPQISPKPRGTILLAEDKETNIMVVKDYLEYRGYQVVIARNGLEAIQKANEISPDAILMDVQMPEMDGLEAIRRLRADDLFKSTPIIAITAFAMPGDREKCLAAGANEYLSKPISLKVLKQMIERFM